MPRLLLLLLFLLLSGLTACGGYDAEIEQVKRAETAGFTNEALVKEVAGARGTVAWSAEKASGEDYAPGADIVRVTARIDKPGREGPRSAELAWIVNRGTEEIALEAVTVDGERQTLASGALQILLLRFE